MKRHIICSTCGQDLFFDRYCKKCRRFTLMPGNMVEKGLLFSENSDGGMTLEEDYRVVLKLKRTKLVIPETVGGKPVTRVSGRTVLHYRSIIFPDTVKHIGTYALGGTYNRILTEIRLPAQLEELGDNALAFHSIRELDLPDSMTRVGRGLFNWDRRLTRVKLPVRTEYIGCYAFAECNTLRGIQLPETLAFIGRFAFYNCASIESVNIPDGVEFLADGTFSWCSSLKSVKLGNGLKRIGRAFWYCESLHEIELPDSVETIRNGAFLGCDDIRVTYRGRVYTQENLSEIYDDTPMPLYSDLCFSKPRAYPDWDYAIPGAKDVNISYGHLPIDAKAIPELPICRSEDEVTLPPEYDRFFFPENKYRVNDTISDLTRLGNEWLTEWSDNPYGMGDDWSGEPGGLKTAFVSEQARLLKKYLDIDVYFKYERILGNLGGFVMIHYQQPSWMWDRRKKEKTDRALIDVTDEWTEHLKDDYRVTKVRRVREFIGTLNLMIREYLEWCYRRDIDPLLYNIIPLNTGGTDKIEPVCHTDLGRLVVPDRLKEDR